MLCVIVFVDVVVVVVIVAIGVIIFLTHEAKEARSSVMVHVPPRDMTVTATIT